MFTRLAIVLGLSTFAITAAPQLAAADELFNCNVAEVWENATYIHVECVNRWDSNGSAAGGDQVRYFALPKASFAADVQSRFVSLASSAMLSGKFFRFNIRSATSNNPAGCGTTNCRAVNQFGMR